MTSALKKIIIVEDQTETADLFEIILSDEYEVIKIHTSTSAMSVIQAELPDVVLLDIMMPDVTGWEILDFIRREPDLQHIPVVLISAYHTMRKDIHKGMDAGANAYLTKPVNVDKLRKTLARVIRVAEDPDSDLIMDDE